MSAEAVAVGVLSITTIGVVAIGMFVIGFGAFVWARAMVKVANGQLVFRQLDELGRPIVEGRKPDVEQRDRLPTQTRMADLDEADLRAAAAAGGTVFYDEDPDRGGTPDDGVSTTDGNAGFVESEPPVPGTAVVRARR